MKDIFLIALVIIIVFIGGEFTRNYLIDSGKTILDDLDILEEEIKIENFNDMDFVIQIKEKWNKIQRNWNILSDHQNTDEVQREFEKLIVNYESEEKEECLINIVEIKSIIEDTPRGEEFSLVNIL